MTDTATTDRPTLDTAPAPRWARVEIFGHVRHHGLVSEVEQFGTRMLRVDVFTDGDVPIATHDYGGAAIFSVTPCTEAYARETEKTRREGSGYGTPLRLSGPSAGDDDEPF